jgi:hypothetical protein
VAAASAAFNHFSEAALFVESQFFRRSSNNYACGGVSAFHRRQIEVAVSIVGVDRASNRFRSSAQSQRFSHNR